ncbi:class I SAM-dependent methyltransferase, partial [Streptomyces sp. NPDC005070]
MPEQKGDQRLVAYIEPDPDAAVADTAAQVEEWRQLHDDAHADAADETWGEDFQPWKNIYTGEPIPHEQLRQWQDAALAQVLRHAPRRILEIGAGSGLLLAKIAGQVEEYWGTDLSAAAIDRLRTQAETAGHGERVHLAVQAADDLTGLPRATFDTVVLDSVVQYLPSAAHLDQVLTHILELLAPGGRIIVGDVRNAATQRILATAEQRAQQPYASHEEIRAAVEQALLAERELLLAPEWFAEWADRHGLGADIRLKAGQAHNALTRHRYEVVLHTEPAHTLDLRGVPAIAWGAEVSDLTELAAQAQRAGGPLRVTGIPNARLAEGSAGPGTPPPYRS